ARDGARGLAQDPCLLRLPALLREGRSHARRARRPLRGPLHADGLVGGPPGRRARGIHYPRGAFRPWERGMNLEFSEDQKFVQKTGRDFLARRAGLEACRRVLESPGVAYDAELWKGVAEMGWLGAAVPEAHGGAGLGHLELVLIAEEIGRA